MNSFYDSDLELSYRISNRKAVMDPVFYEGEPIWVTAEKQGLTSASFYWVGSEAPVKGIQPTYWKPYQHDFPYAQRIDTVIAWLNLPESQRPRLIMLYFDEPDGVGHAFGPNAPETFAVLRQMDSLIGQLYARLQVLPIFDKINLIVTSDHGMGPISPDRAVVLSEILDPAWIIRAEGGNPSYNLQVREGFMDSVMSRIKAQPHLQAWKTNEAPERLHYRDQ
jgi:alkaline phosphatase D